MTWLLWRQHRMQATLSAVLLAALAGVLWPTGVRMAHLYHAAVTSCRASDSCDGLSLFRGYGAVIDLVNLTLIVPVLLGALCGAPLLGREIETGTHILAWTQSLTRRHWLTAKLTVLLAASVLVSAAVSAIVTWWSGTLNSLYGQRFDPLHFEIQGVVPVAYTLFGVSLGITAGALFRRSLPALGVTIFGYLAVRILVENYLRPQLLHPLTSLVRLDAQSSVGNGAWILRSTLVVDGRALDGTVPVPVLCTGATNRPAMDRCLSDAGFRRLTEYQPAGRWWTFQLMEGALFVLLAALLIAGCVLLMRRRDA
jgi:hypothetical protein